MRNLRTHIAQLFGILATTALTGCAGANFEAQSAQNMAADGTGDSSMDVGGGGSGALSAQRANADVAIGAETQTDYADTDPSAVTEFREPLAPYGNWVDDSTYGTVWVPHTSVVGADFTPYSTAGHWTYDDEWVWVSDYSWGWAPFHYGRWTYIGGRGWGWIPGRAYRGAWVSWRTGPMGYGYVGWAPMAPSWYWYNGYAYGLYSIPPSPYVFCSTRNVFSPGVSGHIVRGPEVAQIGAGTQPHTPASPTVDRARATPSVDAAPSPRGTYGPKPEALGLSNADIVRTPRNNAGVSQAQAYATPATAIAKGAAAPGAVRAAYTEPRNNDTRSITGASVATAPRFTPTTDLTRSAAPPPVHASADPNNRTPYTAAVTGPRYIGVEPRTSASFAAAAQSRYANPADRAPSLSRAPTVSPYMPRAMPPSQSSPGSFSSAPSYARPSSPSYSAPSYSRPSSPSYSAPSYSRPSSPSYSAPSYSRPSSPSYSAPSYSRPSSPSYSRPSSPSVSAPSRPSAPSVRSSPSVRRR